MTKMQTQAFKKKVLLYTLFTVIHLPEAIFLFLTVPYDWKLAAISDLSSYFP